MTCVSFDSLNLKYRDFDFRISYFLRPGQEETLIFLHGLGSTKYDFLEVLHRPALERFTVLAIDFPGSGHSTYKNGLRVDDLVQLTSQAIATLQLSELNLIGHSMGGLAALLFADRFPGRVKRLVSIEGNLAPEDCEILSRPTSTLSLEAFSDCDFLRTFEEKYAALPYLGARVYADTFRKNISSRAFHDYCVSIVAHSDNSGLLQRFENLKAPRLFIYGAANGRLSYIPKLRRHGVSVVEITNGHHWPHIDDPSACYEAIETFLATH